MVTTSPDSVARIRLRLEKNGGKGGIRTHGTLLSNGFQDRLLKPLGHLSVAGVKR